MTMPDPTPDEIEAGVSAAVNRVGPTVEDSVEAVLRAVLPDHDARIRTQLADEIAALPEADHCGCGGDYIDRDDAIARAHTTPPEGDTDG